MADGFGATASYLPGEPPPRLPVDADIPPGVPTELPGGVWAARNPVNFPASQQDQRDVEFQRALLQNVRVQDAAKAVEAAMRFQGMRGYERDLAMAKSAGLSDEQAATHALIRNSPRMFFNHPQAIAPAVRAMAPVPAPTTMDLPGVGTVVRSGARGDRVQFPPGMARAGQTQHELGSVVPVNDPKTGESIGYVVATGPQTGRFEKADHIGQLTASQNVARLRARASVIQAQISSPPTDNEQEAAKWRADRLNDLADVQRELAELGRPKTAAKAPAGVVGSGLKATDPAKPQTKDQFQALPSGSFYINPSDGKLMRKK